MLYFIHQATNILSQSHNQRQSKNIHINFLTFNSMRNCGNILARIEPCELCETAIKFRSHLKILPRKWLGGTGIFRNGGGVTRNGWSCFLNEWALTPLPTMLPISQQLMTEFPKMTSSIFLDLYSVFKMARIKS